MSQSALAALYIFLSPALAIGLPWAVGQVRVNRKAPRRIPMSAVTIIRR